jgi:polysaccharide export outer membrane protein
MKRVILCCCLVMLLLTGCSWLSSDLTGSDVVAQASAGDKVSFDVVKIDDAVVSALRAQGEPAFHERFKKYTPPPDIKIAVGDTVSVVIWEAAANGLFGNSLTELSVPPGVTSRLFGTATRGTGALLSTGESATAFASDAVRQLLGLSQAGGTAGAATPAGTAQGLLTPGAVEGFAALPGAAQGLAASDAAQGLTPGVMPGVTPGLAATPGQELAGGAALGLSGFGLGAQQTTPFGAAPAGGASSTQSRASLGTPSLPSRNVQELLQHAVESGRPGTRIPDQQVGPDGAISIPYAGRIAAAGHTTGEVERTIEKELGPKALEPHAIVVIRRSVANSVSVAGEALKGGRVPLSAGGDRLLQIIATASGGAAIPQHELFVRLSRNGTTETVPLKTLVEHPEEDIFAEPGDVLTLVRRPKTFSTFGATGKNTAITFDSEKLSLAEALAKAGGLLDDRADPQAVFLFRYEPAALVRALGQPIASAAPEGVSPVVYRLDLGDAKSYPLAREFRVRDKDVIFVANAEGRAVYKFFSALSKVTGPVVSGFLTCQSTGC